MPARPRRLALILATATVLAAGGCATTGAASGTASNSAEQKLRRLAEHEKTRGPAPGAAVPVPPGVGDGMLAARPDTDLAARLTAEEAMRQNALSATDTAETPAPATGPVADAARDQALWHYAKGRDAALRGRNLVAITELEKAHELDPGSSVIIRQLARSYGEMGNDTRSASYFRQLLQLEPDDSEALFVLGLTATNRRDFRHAAAYLARPRLAGVTFDHDPAAACLADFMLATGMRELGYDRAWIELATASIAELDVLSGPTAYRFRYESLYRQRSEIWRGIGDAHCRLGEYPAALAAYAVAARLPTTDPQGLPPRVIYASLARGGRWSAQYELLRAIDREGGASDQDIRMCQYLAEQLGDVSLLADALVEKHRQRPDDATLVRAAATLLPQADAAALLRSFLHRRPADLAVLGQLLDWLVARDARSAVILTVALAEDHPELGTAYGDQLAEVARSPQQLINTARGLPASPARAIVLCRLLVYVGALGPAWSECAAAVERWPQEESLHLQQIDLAARLDEPQILATVLAATTASDDALAWRTRARAHRILGETEEAVRDAARAVELDPGSAEALVELATTHVAHAEQMQSLDGRRQHAEDASRAAQHALDLDPKLDDAYAILLGLHAPNAVLADRAQLTIVRGRLIQDNPDSALAAQLDAPEDIAQGRWEQALQRLLVVCENDPTDRASLQMAIAVWTQAGRTDDAIAYLDKRLKDRPADPLLLEQWVGLMTQDEHAEHDDEVVARLESLLDSEPSHDTARQLLETVERRDGRLDRAVELAETRLLSRPVGMHRQLELAALYAGAERDDQAVSQLHWVLDRVDDARFEQLVNALAIAGRMSDRDAKFNDLVLTFAQDTVERFPEAPLQVYGTGLRALARAGITDERFDDLAYRAVQFARGGAGPTIQEVDIWRQLAQALVDAGYPAAAGRAVRMRLLADAPLETPARTLLTVIVLVSDAAAADAEAAVELIEALALRGWLPRLPGMDEPPDVADVFYEASIYFNMLGDDAGTERLLTETIRRKPDHAMALNNLGYTRLELGLIDEQTVQYIEHAHDLVADDSNVLDTVGWLRYKTGHFDDQGDTPGALSLINRSLEKALEPSPEVLDHLGDTLWRLGDAKGATDAWRRAAGVLQNADRRENLQQTFLMLQVRGWGIVVAEPEQMYDRQYGDLLERTLEKIRQADAGDEPAVARTVSEIGVPDNGEANDGGA